MADLIPVIRGVMGGRKYYIGKMTFQELAAKVQFFADLNASTDLDTLLQRQLKKRSEEMTTYLLRQPERFYGAIIVAAWGGHAEYVEVRMEDHPLLDDDFEFGLLKFDGRQDYFALDGQHRLKSIKEAIEQDASLRREEVSVVFVTHNRTEEGNVKTRRLFHTLNRYARKTTPGEDITLDEDNAVSIVTRMLLKSGIKALNARYIEVVKTTVGRSRKDEFRFTSLDALYKFNLAVLEGTYSFPKDYLKYRPEASEIENIYATICSLWINLAARVPEFKQLESESRSASEIRERDGDASKGHLLFRPLGLRIFGAIIAQALVEAGEFPMPVGSEVPPKTWEKALGRVSSLPLTLGQAPWRNTIFRNNRMETGARLLAQRLACYMLSLGHVDEEKLLAEYRGHLDDDEVELPTKVK